MDCTVPDFDVNLDPAGFIVDLGSLFEFLARLTDGRCARGKRYALVTILVFLILAKLAGQDRLYGISQWVRHRKEPLAEAFHLKVPRGACANTYKNILEKAISIEELERVLREFFSAQPRGGQSIVICLDGKTLRGTIAAGQSRGQHLLAAYLPAEGWVLFQIEVDRHENEIVAAPTLLKCLDLRGKIVSGDATPALHQTQCGASVFAQRELSLQIVEAGGNYVWTVKDNQSRLKQDIELLFQPEQTVKGFSSGTQDFRTAQTTEKGHGRLESRRLTVSAELKGYLDWPGAEQVFKLERRFTRLVDGHLSHEVAYGITSLTAQEAGPQELLSLVRSHWAIENGLHYRRDETLREDWCHLKRGQAPRAIAVINNLIVGLALRLGWTNLPAARRYYNAYPNEAQRLVLSRLV
jgi:predicted transposase YbfD/YdcC